VVEAEFNVVIRGTSSKKGRVTIGARLISEVGEPEAAGMARGGKPLSPLAPALKLDSAVAGSCPTPIYLFQVGVDSR
jgi:hypothetical protein